jgi:hypothetical protein
MKIEKILFAGFILLHLSSSGQAPGDIKGYLNNKNVSIVAKDFYSGKFKASDDERTLSILDSLKTRNNLTKPFYIYLVSIMMDKSDGALSEVLGEASKEFIEHNPNEAIDFLYSSNKVLIKKFRRNWAFRIGGEFVITCEGKEKECAKKSLEQTVIKISRGNKSKLTQFYKQIEAYCH